MKLPNFSSIKFPRRPMERRDLLRWAAGLGMSFTLPGLTTRAAERRGTERPRSLLTIWLSGGPSQLETWDPHPGSLIGGPTRAIDTSIKGVQIAEGFPLLAGQLHHLSVIRSLTSREGDHDRATYTVKTGFRPDPTVTHPGIGAIVAHAQPSTELELPPVVSLGQENSPWKGGFLGGSFNALQVREPGQAGENVRDWIEEPRQQRRLDGLDLVGKRFLQGRGAVVNRTQHEHSIEAAIRMMTSEQVKAFEIDEEPEEIRAAYGDSNFGRGLLVARRLIEEGVRSVEVTLQNFDTHDDNFTRHQNHATVLDPAFAALLKDLAARDLLASTAVLCLGEFGRTPRINGAEGRDHWPHGFSCLVGGAGLKGGQLIGATDPAGEREKPEDPIGVDDLYATVLTALAIDPAHQVQTPIGRPIKYSNGKPIGRLLG